jgi:hypothetical protein
MYQEEVMVESPSRMADLRETREEDAKNDYHVAYLDEDRQYCVLTAIRFTREDAERYVLHIRESKHKPCWVVRFNPVSGTYVRQ